MNITACRTSLNEIKEDVLVVPVFTGETPRDGALAILDGLPSFLEWCEVPLRAPLAHDPEATLRRIEREPSPDRKRLDDFVLSEILTAVYAGAEHGFATSRDSSRRPA